MNNFGVSDAFLVNNWDFYQLNKATLLASLDEVDILAALGEYRRGFAVEYQVFAYWMLDQALLFVILVDNFNVFHLKVNILRTQVLVHEHILLLCPQ